MWRHTVSHHGGVIGNYKKDYKYKLLKSHKHLISKHCNEGWRQTRFEQLQHQGKVVVLNSKLDFTRPFMTHLTMQKGSGNIGPGLQQLPHSSRPIAQPRNRSNKFRRVHTLKVKSKTVKFRTGPFRNSTGPSKIKTGPFRISSQSKPARSLPDSQMEISDNTDTEKTEYIRHNIQTDNQSHSILISGYSQDISSLAKPRKATKRRASTPVSLPHIQKHKLELLPLSPIKELDQDDNIFISSS